MQQPFLSRAVSQVNAKTAALHIQATTHVPSRTERVASLLVLSLVIGVMMAPDSAFAQYSSSGSMPWDGIICRIASSMSGPVAKGGAIIAASVCGLTMAFGEMNGYFKTLLTLLIGCCLALLGASWIGSMTTGGTLSC